MNQPILRLGRNLGIILLVVAALISGYFLRVWLAPEKPAEQPKTNEKGAKTTEVKVQWWICTMHPWIRQSKPGKCPICPMDLVAASAEEEGSAPRELVMTERGKELAGIQTSPVERRQVSAEIRLSGKVRYDETRLSTITAWVPGRINRLYVDYTGSTVDAGQHLAELYSPELLSAQEELIQAAKAVRELEKSDVAIMRDTAKSTAEAARNKLRLLGLSQEQIDEIESRGTAADHVTITAPIGGTVVAKNVKRGDYVNVGMPLYTIADLSRVWVTLDAYESDLAWLGRGGQEVIFTTEGSPGQEFRGRIAFVAPMVDEKTRTVEVRATVPNPGERLLPDMLVSGIVRVPIAADASAVNRDLAGKWLCTMHPDVIKGGPGECDTCGMDLVAAESVGYVSPAESGEPLVIPDTAPLLTGKRAVVYVEVPGAKEPTYRGRDVTLGPKAGNYYVVLEGLKEGERVVTEGNFFIDSDLQIKGKQSMMSPAGGAMPMHDHGSGQTPGPVTPSTDHSGHAH